MGFKDSRLGHMVRFINDVGRTRDSFRQSIKLLVHFDIVKGHKVEFGRLYKTKDMSDSWMI